MIKTLLRAVLSSGLASVLVSGMTGALMAASPAAAQPAPAAALEVAGLWRIDQARTEPLYDRTRARLDFGAAGRLSGHTSCNTLSATYTLDGTRLQVGPVSTTRSTCGRLQMEQEDRILTALELATSARVRSDGLLELRDDEGRGVLRGTRFETGD